MNRELRVNQRIMAREVRLVGEKGEQLGIMPIAQALEMARKNELDLVEVSSTSVPPVCRMMDYGKYKYDKEKKEREARKSQKIVQLREIRIRPKIGDHDFESKARLVKKLIGGGDKVKVTIFFRGREVTHADIGWRLLRRMTETVKDVAVIERQPLMEGNRLSIILFASATQKPKEPKPAKEEPKESEETEKQIERVTK
ncbi:MAG: translation initiation factor IF-3 [Chloroflexi bacterium]|nr:translation initiation factor IF-3 [Chloroflexota bacterium]